MKRTLDDKLEIIENMDKQEKYSEQDILMLIELTRSDEEEIRARVAELLGFGFSDLAETALIKLLDDEDELVRVNACDSLCNSKNIFVYSRLKDIVLQDTSFLVKNYALLSMVDIAINVISIKDECSEFLITIIQKDYDELIKISSYRGLYLLGKREYFADLIRELQGEVYQNRCATVNMLEEIINSENREAIRASLVDLRKRETSSAVLSSIDRVLANL